MGIQVYVPNVGSYAHDGVLTAAVSSVPDYLEDKWHAGQRFISEILLPIAGVFDFPPEMFNVFWDEESAVIAFNTNGALFFNA